MRLLLETEERTWSLGPGLSLIGTATDCHVRLPSGPPYAGAVVRWFYQNTLYPIGTPAPLQVNGQTHGSHQLRHGDLMAMPGFVARVRFDPAPTLESQMPERASLVRRLRMVLDAGKAFAVEEAEDIRSRKLLRVVSAVTGARAASTGSWEAGSPVELRLYSGPSRQFMLGWGRREPPPDLEHRLGSLGAAIDDFNRSETRGLAPVLPYREFTLRIRQQDCRVGAYYTLGWADLSHLDLPRHDVRDPLVLATTFEERLHLVDLSASGVLRRGNRPVDHVVAEPGMPLLLLDHVLGVFEHPLTEALLPMRLQSALGAPDEPISGAFALGCLLARLKSPEERAEASLLAAITLSGAHAGSLVWTSPEGDSLVQTLVEVSRHQSAGWMRSTGIPSRHLDALVQAAVTGGKTMISSDVLDDPALASTQYRPGDAVPVVGAAMAIPIEPPGACLLLTRLRGRKPFRASASPIAEEIARQIEPLTGLDRPPARLLPQHEERQQKTVIWLRAGSVRIPLPQEGSLILGRDDLNDVRITGDGSISRQHALIVTTARPLGCQVFDLRSTNGTYVEGRLIEQAPLEPGNRLTVGDLELVLETDPAALAASDEPRFCPVSQPIHDLRPAPLGAAPAPTSAEALELSLPALAMVAGASKARWVRENLFEGQKAPEHCFLVPGALETGGWIAFDGLKAPPAAGARRMALQGEGISAVVDRPLWIGRGPECDIRVPSDIVSRRHAIVIPTPTGCEVVDARSSAGTRINGVPILKTAVAEGDLLEVGPIALVFLEQDVADALQPGTPDDAKQLLRVLADVRADGKDPFEIVSEAMVSRLLANASAIVQLDARGPIVQAGVEKIASSLWSRLEGAFEVALANGCAVVEDIDEPKLYRVRHMTVAFHREPFRSALIVPLPVKPPTVAVALTGRMPRVAFDWPQARWVTALISLLW